MEFFRVVSLGMSPVDDSFLSGSLDKTIRLWDLRSPNCQVGPNLSLPVHVEVCRNVVKVVVQCKNWKRGGALIFFKAFHDLESYFFWNVVINISEVLTNLMSVLAKSFLAQRSDIQPL